MLTSVMISVECCYYVISISRVNLFKGNEILVLEMEPVC